MKCRVLQTWLLQLALSILPSPAPGEDWTRFRGPNGSGVSKDTAFPVEFAKNNNAIWRVPVRHGKSSPVLTDHYIFLTGFKDDKLFTQCFDRETGKLVWERAERRSRNQDVNLMNNPAAITPATDGENVYVFLKDFGLISYDPAGNVRWRVPLGPFTNTMGVAASPIVAEDSAAQRDQRGIWRARAEPHHPPESHATASHHGGNRERGAGLEGCG
jgi:outer membrane protein assembly factor BamB